MPETTLLSTGTVKVRFLANFLKEKFSYLTRALTFAAQFSPMSLAAPLFRTPGFWAAPAVGLTTSDLRAPHHHEHGHHSSF